MLVAALTVRSRPSSANTAVLEAFGAALPPGTERRTTWADDLPAFRPPDDPDAVDDVPPAVAAWRRDVGAAGALVIATPEYAHSAPGTVKNALDWLVGSGEIAGRPIALLTASPLVTGGINAQIALIRTLLAQSGEVVVQLTVPESRRRVVDGAVIHAPTLRRIGEAARALHEIALERHVDDTSTT